MDVFLEMIVPIGMCISGIWAFTKWKREKEELEEEITALKEEREKMKEEQNKPDDNREEDEDTKAQDAKSMERLRNGLASLGCQLEWNEENENYYTTYQGETFMVSLYEGAYYANIYDLWWHEVDLNDIDELARVRRAVNECNLRPIDATVCYTFNEETQRMGIHTKMAVLLVDDIAHYDQYLRVRLNAAFHQKCNFYSELLKMEKDELQ